MLSLSNLYLDVLTLGFSSHYFLYILNLCIHHNNVKIHYIDKNGSVTALIITHIYSGIVYVYSTNNFISLDLDLSHYSTVPHSPFKQHPFIQLLGIHYYDNFLESFNELHSSGNPQRLPIQHPFSQLMSIHFYDDSKKKQDFIVDEHFYYYVQHFVPLPIIGQLLGKHLF